MNIADAKRHIKDTVEAYLATDDMGLSLIDPVRQRPLFLIGAPGIGKTAIVSQVAQELGIGLVSYSMTHHTRQSALGLPYIIEEEFEGTNYQVSEYTMSEIIASVYDYSKRTGRKQGILFLDEINCVSETLYPSMLQFLQFKTFGRHRVPQGWIIVCAGNPPEYNKSVHEFDIVTLDRLRKLEIEPDYDAWKAYALEAGLHPAILSFLEVKRDHFYSVESTPSGKTFVTARGWDDLSQVISLFESIGKHVDKSLVDQFIQDDEIADHFAVYYELFNKYRSDYHIETILSGEFEQDIVQRARKAQFDERLALIGLLLDSLDNSFGNALEKQSVLLTVRDDLRTLKEQLLNGGTVDDTIGATIKAHEKNLADMTDTGLATRTAIRREKLVVSMLKSLSSGCDAARTTVGAEAFETINALFQAHVSTLKPACDEATNKLDCAFDFINEAFGNDREMVVFVTELTARTNSSQFINRFGSESYFKNNSKLMVEDRRSQLLTQIDELKLDAPNAGGSESSEDEDEGDVESNEYANSREIVDFYSKEPFEYNYASMCKMTVPDGLEGQTVLDIGCRRGKGVFKFSDKVGEDGLAIGVDWVPDYIAEAIRKSEHAAKRNGFDHNNMAFSVAFPENLHMAGLDDNTVDTVFVNSVSNLFYSLEDSLAEMYRVLKPGGLLVLETVVSDVPRDMGIFERARAIGNSIQASYERVELMNMIDKAGFQKPEIINEERVERDQGADSVHKMPFIPNNENVIFKALVMHIRKPEEQTE